MRPPAITLRGQGVTLRDVEQVARRHAPVTLDLETRERIAAARAVVERIARAGTPVYGLNTALGANTGAPIAPDEVEAYQRRAIEARAVGVGPCHGTDVVRAMMFARVCGMAVGGSGASPDVVEALVAMLNAHVHPAVPSRGSIGAADLAALAHLSLPLFGRGRAEVGGAVVSGSEALARAGLQPVRLAGKDGLALISSNAATLGHAALVLVDAARALDRIDMAVALTHEGFRANVSPLDARVHAARGAEDQARIAARLRGLLDGSLLLRPGAARRVQDPISLRCVTQVHGAALAVLRAARDRVEGDLNAACESPLVLVASDEMLSNGNFDTTALAVSFEALGLALAHVASTCVQRCQRLYSPATSGLPLQLTRRGPEHSGFATVQKTLVSLAAEIRHLAQPITLNAVPVSEALEDHASLAPQAVARTSQMLPWLDHLAAIELMSAAQAIDLRALPADALGGGTRALQQRVRSVAEFLDEDRPLGPDIERLARALHEGDWPTEDLLA